MKECEILRVKTYSVPSYIFSGVTTLNPYDPTPLVSLGFYLAGQSSGLGSSFMNLTVTNIMKTGLQLLKFA